MNVEKFLGQLKSIEPMVRRKRERLQEMEAMLMPKGIAYDGIRVQTSPRDSMCEGVAELVDEIMDLERRVAEDERNKAEVEAIVSQLDPVKIELIYLRYRDDVSMDLISDKIGYSISHTYRLWKEALDEVEVLRNEKSSVVDPGIHLCGDDNSGC